MQQSTVSEPFAKPYLAVGLPRPDTTATGDLHAVHVLDSIYRFLQRANAPRARLQVRIGL